jgi:hypothetical protein
VPADPCNSDAVRLSSLGGFLIRKPLLPLPKAIV